MKRLLTAGMLGLALATAGCATTGLGGPQPIGSQTQLDDRALGLAVTAAHAADLAAEAAVDAGFLKGPAAGKVADALEAAHSAINAAHAAYLLGQDATYVTKLASAKVLVDQALALIPRRKN